MSNLLNRVRYLSKTIKTNQASYLKQQPFHRNPYLLDQPTFTEKPAWLRKFKLKQVALQKNDGRPTFLKKGFFDKVLYNLTLGMVLFGWVWSYKIIEDFDIPYQKQKQ